MISFFSQAGQRQFQFMIEGNVLLAFDFDGTLSPFVTNPDDAHLSGEIRQALIELSQCGPTAIISGRSVADLKKRIDIEDIIRVGNHGGEGLEVDPALLQECRSLTDAWAFELKQRVCTRAYEGVWIEEKGLSLSLHYRSVSDPDRVRQFLLSEVMRLSPLPRIVGGSFVINLLNPRAAHKGVALLQLMEKTGCSKAIYFGDDDTDEDVFALGRPNVLGVRVGQSFASQASLFIESESDILRVLTQLIDLKQQRDVRKDF